MKYQKYLLIFLFPFLHADDLDLGSDFSAGDTVSASAFNSRFNEIEKTIGFVDPGHRATTGPPVHRCWGYGFGVCVGNTRLGGIMRNPYS